MVLSFLHFMQRKKASIIKRLQANKIHKIKYVEYGAFPFEVWEIGISHSRMKSFKTLEEAKNFVIMIEDLEKFNQERNNDI